MEITSYRGDKTRKSKCGNMMMESDITLGLATQAKLKK